MSKKRSESRARYYLREQAQKRGWKLEHPGKGGEVLEEQEIVDFFPNIGLGLDRPDFLLLRRGLPAVLLRQKTQPIKFRKQLMRLLNMPTL